MQKASLDVLIARKMQSDANRITTKDIEVPVLDMMVTVVKLPLSKVLGILDTYKKMEDGLVKNLEMYKELIYYSVPLFQNEKLQEAYDCAEPFDIVVKVLDENIQAIGDLGGAISELYGIGDSVVSEIKN